MGLFAFGRTSSPIVRDPADVVARYQRLRPLRLRLNNRLVERLSREVLNEGAKRLGILRNGTFVFDDEDQMSVLMDYCIYDVRCDGRNAVDQFLCDCQPDPDSEEDVSPVASEETTDFGIRVAR